VKEYPTNSVTSFLAYRRTTRIDNNKQTNSLQQLAFAFLTDHMPTLTIQYFKNQE
jgi:hypothetical protein